MRRVTGVAAAVVLVAGLLALGLEVAGSDPRRRALTGTAATTTAPTVAPTAPPTTVAPAPGEPAAIAELRAQVAQVRGLEWKAPLPVSVVSKAELARRVRETNARDADPAQLAGEGATYKLLHVIPESLDYAKTLDDMYAELVIGFYDPITKRMFVQEDGDGELDPATRGTMAHELDHALTDQHFDFSSKLDALQKAGRNEEAAAMVAVVEGDAELLRGRWADRFLNEDEQVEAFFGGSVDPSAVARVPPFMLRELGFPYSDGLEFVTAKARSGGFEAVNRLYARPPTSTEQILHPELYDAGQGWTAPALPDVAGATGCRPVHHGTIGEFEMKEVLATISGADGSAVAGWGGDAFQVVSCGGVLGMVDRWQGDDAGAAARLADALVTWSSSWSGSDGRPGGDGRFAGSKGAGRVVRSGSRVDLVLAGDRAVADRISAVTG